MGGTARRNFSLFRKLCGEHGLQNVIIVTTRWADVPLETGLKREEQLRSQDNLFRPAIENGATLLRHDNTIQSAYDILEQLVRRQPVPLRIQMELVDEKKDISETAAGAELHRQLEEQAEKFEREIEELRREMNDALRLKDFRMETEIREAKEQFEVKLKQVAESRDKLSQLYAQEKQASEEMKKSIKALEDHQKRVEREHEEERQRHRAQIASVQGVHVDLSKAHEELAAAYSTQVGTMGNKLEELGEALVKEQEKTKQILNEERRVRERDERELQVKAETLKTKLEAERAESEKARAAMIEKERKREEELQKLRDNMREIESKLDRSRKEEQQKRDEEKKAREERKTTPLVSPLPPPPRSQSYQPSPPPPPRSQPPSPPESKGFFATIRSFFSS